MIAAAKKYGIELTGFEPLLEARNSMPLWHSIVKNPERRQINNGEKQECLRTNHGATTIGTGSQVIRRLTQVEHRASQSCQCVDCRLDRDHGCSNPHSCAKTASNRLAQILPKWTHQQVDIDQPPLELPDEDTRILIKPTMRLESLTQGFRVMTKHDTVNETYKPRRSRARRNALNHAVETITISCAGYGRRTGQSNATACGGLWLGIGHQSNIGVKIPDIIPQSPTNGALTVILAGLSTTDEHHNLDIKTNDPLIVQILSGDLWKWEDQGFISLTNKAILKAIIA
ncbi:hypothetical protein C8J56DRAFT_784532 [Mycena floridula]|nr:hypothetical protein C8J56DRAFT_784532 [Mycena floridula]